MALATSYSAAGNMNREHILDKLTILDPEDTPLFNGIQKVEKAGNLLLEWGVQALKNPEFTGRREGVDTSNFENKASTRGKMSNRIQSFVESPQVSRLQQKVNTAAVPSEWDHAKAIAFKDLINGIESAIGSTNSPTAGDSDTNALMGGLGYFANNGSSGIPDAGLMPAASSGTTSTLTETTFASVLQSRYEAVGSRRNVRMYAGTTAKQKVTDFSRAEGSTTAKAYQVHEMATSRTVTNSIMKFDSDWGVVDVIVDLFLERSSGSAMDSDGKARAYILDPEYVKLSFLEQPSFVEYPDQGAGPRGDAEADLTLVVLNAKSLATLT